MKYLLITLLIFSSCASMVAGKTENICIESEPTGQVILVDNVWYTTPVIVTLDNRKEHVIIFHDGQTVEVKRLLNGWIFGNILVFGVVGLIVDGISGAALSNLEPDYIINRDGQIFNGETGKEIE